jgi:glycosyltransferase involved in cell wall biosynthesis
VRAWLGDRLQQYCARRCAGVVSYSEHGARYFQSLGVQPDNIIIGYNTLDEVAVRQEKARLATHAEGLRKSLHLGASPIAIFSGTMKAGKRVDLLLASFARCLRENSWQVRPILLLIGDGPGLQAMKSLAHSTGIIEQTRFVGRQGSLVSAYFQLGQFAVLPGLGGLAINHAFAHGLPVICGPADGCELDLVRNEATGIYLPTMNETTLAAAMTRLFQDPAACQRMGANAFELITGRFSLENYARRIEQAVCQAKLCGVA